MSCPILISIISSFVWNSWPWTFDVQIGGPWAGFVAAHISSHVLQFWARRVGDLAIKGILAASKGTMVATSLLNASWRTILLGSRPSEAGSCWGIHPITSLPLRNSPVKSPSVGTGNTPGKMHDDKGRVEFASHSKRLDQNMSLSHSWHSGICGNLLKRSWYFWIHATASPHFLMLRFEMGQENTVPPRWQTTHFSWALYGSIIHWPSLLTFHSTRNHLMSAMSFQMPLSRHAPFTTAQGAAWNSACPEVYRALRKRIPILK